MIEQILWSLIAAVLFVVWKTKGGILIDGGKALYDYISNSEANADDKINEDN